jgi:hypothetical protein
MRCPKCSREWDEDSEQAICIELYSVCYGCKFGPDGDGTKADNLRMMEMREYRTGREIYSVLRKENRNVH